MLRRLRPVFKSISRRRRNARAFALLHLEAKGHARLPILHDLGAIEILVRWEACFNQDRRVFKTDEFTADRRAAEDLEPLPAIKERSGWDGGTVDLGVEAAGWGLASSR